MRIVCSWCRGEGQNAIVGEKPPLEDLRETHGICVRHRMVVQTRWKEMNCESGVINARLMTAGMTSESSLGHVAMSAAHLWTGLINLTRKSRS